MTELESAFDRVNRLRMRFNMRMPDLAYLVRDENGESLSRNVMGTWSNRGTLTRSIPLISDTFFWSSDYIYGWSQQKWRGDLLAAREQLRDWVRQQDMSRMSIAERFVAVWEKWSTLIPMREDVWAVLTYMAEYLTPKMDPHQPVHISTWLSCKQGEFQQGENRFQPGRMQIDGAADMTGLPSRWWYTGNNVYLRKFTEEEIATLAAIILEPGYDVYDVKAAMTEYAKANV